jgi:hypothetical protein
MESIVSVFEGPERIIDADALPRIPPVRKLVVPLLVLVLPLLVLVLPLPLIPLMESPPFISFVLPVDGSRTAFVFVVAFTAAAADSAECNRLANRARLATTFSVSGTSARFFSSPAAFAASPSPDVGKRAAFRSIWVSTSRIYLGKLVVGGNFPEEDIEGVKDGDEALRSEVKRLAWAIDGAVAGAPPEHDCEIADAKFTAIGAVMMGTGWKEAALSSTPAEKKPGDDDDREVAGVDGAKEDARDNNEREEPRDEREESDKLWSKIGRGSKEAVDVASSTLPVVLFCERRLGKESRPKAVPASASAKLRAGALEKGSASGDRSEGREDDTASATGWAVPGMLCRQGYGWAASRDVLVPMLSLWW